MGKSTIYIAIFNSFLYVYQRVIYDVTMVLTCQWGHGPELYEGLTEHNMGSTKQNHPKRSPKVDLKCQSFHVISQFLGFLLGSLACR
jgi:hypothetical protein